METIESLVQDLKDLSPESVEDTKLNEFINRFKTVTEGELPNYNMLGQLPQWFLLKSLPVIWTGIKERRVLINTINREFKDAASHDFRMRVAALLSGIDSESSIAILIQLARDIQPGKPKQNKLASKFLELFNKYFIADKTALAAIALLETKYKGTEEESYTLANTVCAAFFGGKNMPASIDRAPLQAKALRFLLENNLISACGKQNTARINELLSDWPVRIAISCQDLLKIANSQGIKLYNPDFSHELSEEKNAPAPETLQKLLKDLPLEDIFKELSQRFAFMSQAIEQGRKNLKDKSATLGDQIRKNEELQKTVNKLEEEKRGLKEETETISLRNNRNLAELKAQNAALQTDLNTANSKIEALLTEKDAVQKNFEKTIQNLNERIPLESDKAKARMLELIQEKLQEDYDDMGHLSNDDKHQTAKIMTERIFDKLQRLGINFSSQG